MEEVPMDELRKGLEVSKLIGEILNMMRQNMTRGFGEAKLTAPQGMVVGILSHSGRMKLSDLSQKMGLSNSTVSGIVDRLEKQGVVERIRSEEDRRVIYIATTKSFNDQHKDFHKRMEENMHNLMGKGSAEDIDKIIDGLQTLKKLLSANNSGSGE